MTSEPFFALPAALMGDPARANMLAALLDGRALTAKELAFRAGITPQTASGHLAQLTGANLLSVVAQGRHRYYRLAGPAVAHAIETLMALAGETALRPPPRGRAGEDLAAARTCYDHLAGRLGVAIHDALVARGALVVAQGGYGLSAAGRLLLAEIGIDEDDLRGRGRPVARPCLDWSERRMHLAGPAARALACRCFERGWIERRAGTRAVHVTAEGTMALRRLGLIACEPLPGEAA